MFTRTLIRRILAILALTAGIVVALEAPASAGLLDDKVAIVTGAGRGIG